MKKFIMVAVASAVLVSCTNDTVIEPVMTVDNQSAKTINHTIPVSEAMTLLHTYLDTEQNNGTRSGTSRKVANVKTVVCSQNLTRAGEGIDADTLLYIANFEKNEGYAIMSADDRINEDILAITDAGNITENDITNGLNEVYNESRPVFDGYPTTGPGFFTDEAFGDEVFINPNTIELYDPDRDDTLIGNYDISDLSYSNEKSEG